MSKHTDLQSREEVFRLGDWSIMSAGEGGVTAAHWDSFIFHSAHWEEWKAIPITWNVNTGIKGETVPSDHSTTKQEKVMRHCNENMIAYNTKFCPGCSRRIPEEIVALWTLQNMERIQEVNSV